jgi:hypothetical protein
MAVQRGVWNLALAWISGHIALRHTKADGCRLGKPPPAPTGPPPRQWAGAAPPGSQGLKGLQ